MRVLVSAIIGLVCLFSSTIVHAQQNQWIQVEARADLNAAQLRAEDYETRLDAIEGYVLRSGWHAIVIGPLTAVEAPVVLRQLRATGQIPSDAYLVNASTFRTQFWPPLGARPATTAQTETETQVEEAPRPEPQVADETPAQARRSEALLTREERMGLQSALAWEDFYSSAIDGAIGRGSRNAMAAWQVANGYEATGILTTKQRGELIDGFRSVLADIGMAPLADTSAGIEIDLPFGLINQGTKEAPFVRFTSKNGDLPQVLLISQSGDQVALGALYEVIQTLRVVPLDGPRRLRRNSFSIEGINDASTTTIYAEQSGDDVKGYALIWPNGDEKRRALVWAQMQQSFSAVPGRVLADDEGSSMGGVDLFAGLEIRRADVTQSGFYVSDDAHVVTSATGVGNCDRVTLGDGVPASISAVDADLNIALLAPDVNQVPVSVASLAALPGRINSEIAVSGFSFGGRLGAPSLTYGTLDEIVGLDGNPDMRRLSVASNPSDVGGPIVSNNGAVVAMLLPRPSQGRVLPQNVHPALGASAISAFLTDNGVATANSDVVQASFGAIALSDHTSNFTVLVSCWR